MSIEIIQSEEDAYAFLQHYLIMEGKISTPPKFNFESWPKFKIRLTGDRFEQSLTPSVMRGLIAYQDAIDHSMKFDWENSLNLKARSSEELERLDLKVRIDKGSTNIEIDIQALLTEVLTKTVSNMDPVSLAVLVSGLALIWTGSTTAKHYINFLSRRAELQSREKIEKARSETIEVMTRQETERLQALSDIINKFPQLYNAATFNQLAKQELLIKCTAADSIEVEGCNLRGETLEKFLDASYRHIPELLLNGTFLIDELDIKPTREMKVWLREPESNATHKAYIHSNRAINAPIVEALQTAYKNKTKITLNMRGRLMHGRVADLKIVSHQPSDVSNAEATANKKQQNLDH